MVYESYNRDGTKKLYLSGIHVIDSEELCQKYLLRFKNKTNKTIVVCEVDQCRKKPKGKPGVMLADKIKVLSDKFIKINQKQRNGRNKRRNGRNKIGFEQTK